MTPCPTLGGLRSARVLALTLCLVGFQAPALSQSQPKIIGELELRTPSSSEVVLRGTLPVPPNFYPTDSTTSPVTVLDWDGTPVPTQSEVVTRYADGDRGADVIEVLARVHLDPNASQGGRVRYQIAADPQAAPKLPDNPKVQDLTTGLASVSTQVRALVQQKNSVRIGMDDVFGNTYEFHPFDDVANQSVVLERYGRIRSQVRTYGVMKPNPTHQGGPKAPLNHTLGVHSYISTTAGEDVVLMDLRFNNGPDGYKQEPDAMPVGKLYFGCLHIGVPEGWVVLTNNEDPFWGAPATNNGYTVYPIVDRLHGDALHVVPPQGQFHRRLAIAPQHAVKRARELLSEEGLGFARRGRNAQNKEYFSWWNPLTARYFPQKHILPGLDHLGQNTVRGKLTKEYLSLRERLMSGKGTDTYPFDHGQLGWARPFGVQYGGMTGGDEIHLFRGLRTAESSSVNGYRAIQLVHRMHSERAPNVLFGRRGEPTTVEKWVQPHPGGDYVDMYFYMKLLGNTDPFGYSKADQTQANFVAQTQRKPPYEDTLLQYQSIDLQHLVRNTRNSKALVWLGNDALAKDDLLMQAELFRLSYHPYFNSKFGGVQGTGLRADMDFVTKRPGIGFPFGRGEGWGIDAVNAVYAFSNDHFRKKVRPWYDQIAQVVADGQVPCSGFIQAEISPKMLQGKYRARQAIEQAIIENALRGMVETVYRGVSFPHVAMVEDTLLRSIYSWTTPLAWSQHHGATWALSAVGPLGFGAPYCQSLPPSGHSGHTDTFQNLSSFAYGVEYSNDPEFLFLAAQIFKTMDLLQTLENRGTTNLENRAAMLALLQKAVGDI